MFDGSVEASRLAEPEMIAREDGTWLTEIAGSRARTPGGVSLHGIQPADQIARGTPHRSGPG